MTTKSLTLPRIFSRPSAKGIWGWIGTVDHKRIGTLYGITSFIWFLIAGFEALIMRVQLSHAEAEFISPDFYNQLFTMHGTSTVSYTHRTLPTTPYV